MRTSPGPNLVWGGGNRVNVEAGNYRKNDKAAPGANRKPTFAYSVSIPGRARRIGEASASRNTGNPARAARMDTCSQRSAAARANSGCG